MTPRENQDVNGWWMCDPGRLGYGFVNSPTRVLRPRVREGPGNLRPATYDEAISAAAKALGAAVKGGVVADAGLTLEELWLLRAATSHLRGDLRYASKVGDDEDGFLVVNEKGANQRGAEMLGYARATGPSPAAILAVERADNVPKDLREGALAPVVFATDEALVPPSAEVVFPLPTWAEKDGFVVNCDGIVQPVRRSASAGPKEIRSLVEVLEEVRVELDAGAAPLGLAGALEEIRALDSFRGVAVPEVSFGAAPAPTVAAPAGRTR
jgi:NADH dehydrogenase/NADH:ubiquinone oxidoreductase subunit G